jgi:transposase
MIGPPIGTRIWLVAGHTDLRKGVDGLCALVQNHLKESPFTGEVYLFRGKGGNKIKVLWATPEGMSFLYKRLNDAKFVWPQVRDGTVCLSAAQLEVRGVFGGPQGGRAAAADPGGAESGGRSGRARECSSPRATGT